jgi:O-antigen/teichoic acid export membrane protein
MSIFHTIQQIIRSLGRNQTGVSRNFILYFIGSLAFQGISFFLIPLYTRYLTTAQYGSLELLNTFINILYLLLTLGIILYIGIEFFHYQGEERREKITALIIFYLLWALPATVLMMAMAPWLVQILGMKSVPPWLFALGAVISFLQFFQTLAFLILQMQKQALRWVGLQLSLGLVSVGLNIFFIVFRHLDYRAVLYTQLITLLGLCALFGWQVRESLSFTRIKAAYRSIQYRPILAISLPLMVASLADWVIYAFDRWVLNHYCSSAEVGLYALSYNFAKLFSTLVIASISGAYSPYIYGQFQDRGVLEPERENLAFIKAFGFIFLVVLPVIYVAGKPVVQFVVGSQFQSSYHYILPIAFGYLFLGITYLLQMSTNFLKRTRIISLMYVAMAAANVALSFGLIPRYGIWGATWASCLTYFIMMVLAFFVRHQTLRSVYCTPEIK